MPDILTQAIERAKNVLSLMERHKVPPTPENYAVWYAYLDGADAALVKAIEQTKTSGSGFGAARNAELYQRFYADKAQSDLVAMERRLEGSVNTALDLLNKAVSNASQYGTSLEHFSDDLARQPDAFNLAQLINDILHSTRLMMTVNTQLSMHLSATIEQADQLQTDVEILKQEVSVDHLTRLFNRRWLEPMLEQVVEQARAEDRPVCMLMLDVDRFKRFNDTYGHVLGDQVLKLVASTIQGNILDTDMAARYGGEEFAVLMPGTLLTQACRRAETIRARMAARQVTNRNTGKVLGQITLSIGVATLNETESAADFINRADLALYAAKEKGRNRVEMAANALTE